MGGRTIESLGLLCNFGEVHMLLTGGGVHVGKGESAAAKENAEVEGEGEKEENAIVGGSSSACSHNGGSLRCVRRVQSGRQSNARR